MLAAFPVGEGDSRPSAIPRASKPVVEKRPLLATHHSILWGAMMESGLSLSQETIMHVLLELALKDGVSWMTYEALSEKCAETHSCIVEDCRALVAGGWLVETDGRDGKIFSLSDATPYMGKVAERLNKALENLEQPACETTPEKPSVSK